ncbi:MAG: glycosyltransferase [Acidobacteria bacterium]|nr:glycosyltransferase [Acidobacteriota bacterium]
MTIKVAFLSCKEPRIEAFLNVMRAIYPDVPLCVMSEFPPPQHDGADPIRWVPFKPNRTIAENMARLKASIKRTNVRLSAVVLDPDTPYWQMKWLALALSPVHFIAFNTNLDNFMLRPRCANTIARHFYWRIREQLVFQTNPGGTLYTWLWRLTHPKSLRRPASYHAARLAAFIACIIRRVQPPKPDPAPRHRTDGISVVVPTRNGKDLISRLLPGVLPQLPHDTGEVIVVDNGSDDGTADYLRATYPQVRIEVSPEPLSFAAAVNRGIRAAHYSHVCLLNNDMIVEPDFFGPLRDAFYHQPDLFCATAQILFPEGMRRQETGKAVYWSKQDDRTARDFPIRCLTPIDGEDHSYVLYGSGGCSMYDAAKLEQIGAFDELLAPAYVEDLDLGWRAWQRNWPTVYVAAARVTHFHRSTTTRYYRPEMLQSFVEYNYLRFLARHVNQPAVFRRLWSDALSRLNRIAVDQSARPGSYAWAEESLAFAWKATRHLKPAPTALYNEEWILALGSGLTATFSGRLHRDKPRVLIASPYIPFPLSHGGAVRIFNLMRCAAQDHDQILVAFVDELKPPPQELLDITAEIILVKRHGTHLFPDQGRPDVVEEFCSPAMQAVLRQTVRKWKPTVAQLEFTWMAQYASDCAPVPTIMVEHDITYDLQQQLLAQSEDWETRRQCERWRRHEHEMWRKVDAVVVMSEKDRHTVAAETKDTRAVVLANGVDLHRFQSAGQDPEPRRILFIGSFAHLPNVLALDFFLRECWPILQDLQPTLHVIAGSRHHYFLERYQDTVRLNLNHPGIEVEDFVSDVRPAYEKAAIVIAPLIASAGTNIKVMEAMAMRKAIVSTPAGINGLDLTNGRDVIVVETGAAMAAAIRALMEDPAGRRKLEAEARLTVERDFDWRAIARHQAALYHDLLNRPK